MRQKLGNETTVISRFIFQNRQVNTHKSQLVTNSSEMAPRRKGRRFEMVNDTTNIENPAFPSVKYVMGYPTSQTTVDAVANSGRFGSTTYRFSIPGGSVVLGAKFMFDADLEDSLPGSSGVLSIFRSARLYTRGAGSTSIESIHNVHQVQNMLWSIADGDTRNDMSRRIKSMNACRYVEANDFQVDHKHDLAYKTAIGIKTAARAGNKTIVADLGDIFASIHQRLDTTGLNTYELGPNQEFMVDLEVTSQLLIYESDNMDVARHPDDATFLANAMKGSACVQLVNLDAVNGNARIMFEVADYSQQIPQAIRSGAVAPTILDVAFPTYYFLKYALNGLGLAGGLAITQLNGRFVKNLYIFPTSVKENNVAGGAPAAALDRRIDGVFQNLTARGVINRGFSVRVNGQELCMPRLQDGGASTQVKKMLINMHNPKVNTSPLAYTNIGIARPNRIGGNVPVVMPFWATPMDVTSRANGLSLMFPTLVLPVNQIIYDLVIQFPVASEMQAENEPTQYFTYVVAEETVQVTLSAQQEWSTQTTTVN